MENIDRKEINLNLGLWGSLIISTIYITQAFFSRSLFVQIFLIGMGLVWLIMAGVIFFNLQEIEDLRFLAMLRAYASQSIKESHSQRTKRPRRRH